MKIGNKNFSIGKFSNFRALKLHRKLAEKIGPSIGNVIGALKEQDKDIDGGAIAEALQNLFLQLPEDEYVDIIKELFAVVRFIVKEGNGRKEVCFNDDNFEVLLDSAFDDPFDVYKIMWEVLKLNFSPLFSVMKNITNKLTTFMSQKEEENETT